LSAWVGLVFLSILYKIAALVCVKAVGLNLGT